VLTVTYRQVGNKPDKAFPFILYVVYFVM